MPGHNPSHEANFLALLKRDRSGPTSAMTFSAVVVSMPFNGRQVDAADAEEIGTHIELRGILDLADAAPLRRSGFVLGSAQRAEHALSRMSQRCSAWE